MKNEQILERALEKAVKGGWNVFGWELEKIKEYKEGGILVGDDGRPLLRDRIIQINTIIFAHEFAKAFWGEEVEKHNGQELWLNNKKTYKWQYHQHQMLDEIQEGRNPIKYLEQFL